MTIRPATPDDYTEIVRVSNLAMPQYHLTIEQLERHDNNRDPRCKLGYFVAVVKKKIVGYARYIQWADIYHPQVFWTTVQVQPDHQRQGIGTQLHQQLSDTLAPFEPITFKSSIYEGDVGALAFSQANGYQEYSRRIESTCDLQTVDLSEYLPGINKLKSDGIDFIPMSDLLNNKEAVHGIYRLQWALELDVPMDETLTQPSIEQWRNDVVDSTLFVPSASFVARQGDDYIGLTEIFRYSEKRLYIEFTGTRPQYRRRGIATAMKVLGLQWGQENGYQVMGTTNDAVNTGIIAINQKLGFVAQLARIQMEKFFE